MRPIVIRLSDDTISVNKSSSFQIDPLPSCPLMFVKDFAIKPILIFRCASKIPFSAAALPPMSFSDKITQSPDCTGLKPGDYEKMPKNQHIKAQ